MKQKLIILLTIVTLYFPAINVLGQAVWTQYNGPFAGEISSFATYGDTIFSGSTMTGVFKSVDHGKTWSQTFPEITYVHSLYVHDNALFIGSDRLYKFTPAGLSTVSQILEWGAISYMQSFNDKLFVTTDMGLYLYDAAANQLVLKSDGFPSEDNRATRDLARIDDVLFCNDIVSGLYKSTDQGEHWEKVDVNGYSYAFFDMATRGDSLICVGFENLFVSTDKGDTWTEFTYNLERPYAFFRICVLDDRLVATHFGKGTFELKDGTSEWTKISNRPFAELNYDGSVFLAADQVGLYRWSEADNEFVLSNVGINASRVNEMELFDGKLYSATHYGVHVTSTDGDDWTVVPELDEKWTKAIKKTETKLYVGAIDGLYVTAGTTWNKVESFPSVPIWDIEVNNNKVFVASNEGVYVSENDGASWKNLPNTQSPHAQILHIGVSDTMLVAGNAAGFYRIRPDSTDWERLDFFENGYIESIHIIDGAIYVTWMNSPLYRSFDYGKTWQFVDMPTTSSAYILKRGDNLYAASYNKIFYSADGGTSWDSYYETGIPDIMITSITEGESVFYVGTYGKSIWRRDFLSTTDIASDVYLIEDDQIYNIAPNTTVAEFKSNVEKGYGTSLVVIPQDGESGRVKSTSTIHPNDKIKIIAEDGKTVRILNVSDETRVTGIGEEEFNAIEAFPIPAHDKLFLSHPGHVKSCAVINSVGVKVLHPTLQHGHININELPRGLYVLAVITNTNKRQVLKFIKE